MRAHRTVLTLIATLLFCAAPLWARGGGDDGGGSSNGRSSDSKSDDGDPRKDSGGGKNSSGSGGGSNRSTRSDRSERPKAGHDGTERGKGRDRKNSDRKWPDIGNRDRDAGNGQHRPARCPKGRRDCRESCCNPFGYGETWAGWDPVYDGWGFPWPDYPNQGKVDPDDRRIRTVCNNLELKVTPQSAEVFVNGIRYGRKSKLTLPSGRWTVEIRAEGYQAETLELEIKQGDRYRFELQLRRDSDHRPPIRAARSNS